MSGDSDYGDIRRRLDTAEARARRTTLLVTLVPVLIVVVLVAIAGSRLISANQHLQEEIANSEAVNRSLSAKIATVEGERKRLEEQLASLNQSYQQQSKLLALFADRRVTPATVAEAKELVVASPKIQDRVRKTLAQTPSRSSPRVFLHIADEQQRDPARHLQTALIERGFIVPGVQNVGRIGARVPAQRSEVRYFHREDEKDAVRLTGALENNGVKPIRIVPLFDQKDEPLGKFEVWFSQNAWREKGE